MASKCTVFTLSIVLKICLVASSDVTASDINLFLKRLALSDNLVQELSKRISSLEIRDKKLEERIAFLETENENQKRLIQGLQTETTKLRDELKDSCSKWHQGVVIKVAEEDASEKVQSDTSASLLKSGTQYNKIRRSFNEVPVAFTATVSNHITHAGDHQIIIFDKVITNVGNAYNGHIGSFIAPVDGIYVFSTTLFSYQSVSFHANIVKNGQAITWMYVSGAEGQWDTASQTVVLQLQKGDDVTIQHRDSDRSIYGNNFTVFSGFLLQEDVTSQVVVG